MCSFPNRWAKKCPNRKGRKPQLEQNTTNMVTNAEDGTSEYGNLPFVLSVFQSTN
jgi:hypothetical protein